MLQINKYYKRKDNAINRLDIGKWGKKFSELQNRSIGIT